METAQNTKPVNKGGASYKYTPEQLSNAVEEYIAERRAENLPIHKAGFAVKMHVCADTVTDWLHSDNQGYSEPIKRLATASLAYKNDFLYSGKNPAGVIFDLKNNDGWVDKTETVVSGTVIHQLAEKPRAELIADLDRARAALGAGVVIEGEFEPVE